jgi:hypothetical protein
LKPLTNAELCELIHKHHHKWLSQVAFNLTQDRDNAEDLIQEVYVYLMEMKDIEKIRYNGTVNLFYIYKTIKSKFLNSIKKTKKVTILPIEEDFLEIEDLEYDIEKDAEFEVMLEQTKHLLENQVHWFDARLLQTYIEESHSIASLHIATGISKSSIWTSLSKTKTFIKDSYANTKDDNNV